MMHQLVAQHRPAMIERTSKPGFALIDRQLDDSDHFSYCKIICLYTLLNFLHRDVFRVEQHVLVFGLGAKRLKRSRKK